MEQVRFETPDTLWTTTYLGDALDALRAEGYPVIDEEAAHLTPAQHTITSTFIWTIQRRLRILAAGPTRQPESVL